jgi:hypothetical protein
MARGPGIRQHLGGDDMRKRLLITVSDDTSYLHGVRFVSSFFRSKSLVNVTLFYVAPHAHEMDRTIRKDRLEMESSPSES